MRHFRFLVALAFVSALAACGGGGGSSGGSAPAVASTPAVYALSVNVDGSGTVSAGADIQCGANCTASYTSGTSVTLAATPATDYEFASWSVNDYSCPEAASCIVPMTASRTVSATFRPRRYMLSVSVVGAGTVTSAPAGIHCGGDCSENYARGTSVALTAVAASGYVFSGWSGESACGSSGVCTLSMTAAHNVTATFSPVAATQYTLQVTKTGSGTVTSSPAGISCGSDCSESYTSGSVVTLSATAASGYSFSGWSGGGCSGTGGCTVSMTAARTVAANFVVNSYALSISVQGTGSVTSAPAGINCGTDCTETYAADTTVSLSAVATSGYAFSGWSGSGIACAGTGSCVVSMTTARNVVATFSPLPTYSLSVSVSGSGTVSSAPAGINCGADCSETYSSGASVTLSAAPATGYSFSGWGGACSGVSTCTVSMTTARSVSATFTQTSAANTYLLAWNAVTDASISGYKLYYSTTPFTNTGSAIAVNVGPSTNYAFSPAGAGIASGTALYFGVTAVGDTGESPLSDLVTMVME